MKDLSYKTAIARKKLSLPAQKFQPYLKGRCLDFGCGRGFDADYLGIEKYDPHYFPDYPEGTFDTIMVIYVLNVLQEIKPTLEQLHNLLNPLGGKLLIAARTDKEVRNQAMHSGWKQKDVGWITKSGTYQSGYSVSRLRTVTVCNLVSIGKYGLVKSGKDKFSWAIIERRCGYADNHRNKKGHTSPEVECLPVSR